MAKPARRYLLIAFVVQSGALFEVFYPFCQMLVVLGL